jgi:hypothetical protein
MGKKSGARIQNFKGEPGGPLLPAEEREERE